MRAKKLKRTDYRRRRRETMGERSDAKIISVLSGCGSESRRRARGERDETGALLERDCVSRARAPKARIAPIGEERRKLKFDRKAKRNTKFSQLENWAID